MDRWNEEHLPPELEDVARLLREQRRDPSELELDELKLRARRQAARTGLRRQTLKGRLVTAILTVALLGGGGGAVLAATGTVTISSSDQAAQSQYCPDQSAGDPKPKNPPPGNKCGTPKTKN